MANKKRRKVGGLYDLGDGRFEISVAAGKNPKTGKPARKKRIIRGTQKKAEEALAALIASTTGNSEYAKDKLTLDAYMDSIYFPDARSRLRGRTIVSYENNYNSMIKPFLGSLLLTQITPAVIQKWLSQFRSNRKKFDAYRTLRIFLRHAIRNSLIDKDPTLSVPIPKYKKYKPTVLTSEEAAIYLEHSRGHRIEPFILIAIGAGLRPEEFHALRWGDISQDGDILIDDTVTNVGKKIFEDDTKTDFSERVVRLPKSITDRLNELRLDDDAPIIPNYDGTRPKPDWIRHLYSEWRETLPEGVTRIPAKNLRHTSLTLTLEGGADLLAVSRRAGHASISTTASYYLRPSKGVDEAAADGLDGLLFG